MDIERRLIRNLDIPLIATTLALVAFRSGRRLQRHLFALACDPFVLRPAPARSGRLVGIAGAAGILLTDYRQWGRLARLIYLVTLAILAAVPLFAPDIQGASRWLVIGPVQLQPAEFAKLAVIVTLARRLSLGPIERPADLIGPLLHVALPMALIVLQPDLGTSLIFVVILFGMLYVAGTPVEVPAGLGGDGNSPSSCRCRVCLQPGMGPHL